MAAFASYFQSWLPSSGPASPSRTPSTATTASEPTGRHGGGPRIWPMAPQTVQELRKGVAFNMKVVIRGQRGTGKTTLLSRLCNLPTQTTPYTPSQEISAGTIRVVGRGCAPHEGTKVDIWDVVDEGSPHVAVTAAAALPSGQPLKNQQLEALTTRVADARNVDVYAQCHLAIFMVDPRRRESLTYAVEHARLVPHNICVFFVLNFADTDASTHVVGAREMEDACRRTRRTYSPFLLSMTEGRPVPTNFTVGASWAALSATTGAGMRQLYLALAVPITVLRATALERQLQALYQQMQWPASCHTDDHNDGTGPSGNRVHHTPQDGADEQGQPRRTNSPDTGALRMQHRQSVVPKPAGRASRPLGADADAHGIATAFFGSSDDSEETDDGENEEREEEEESEASHRSDDRALTPRAPAVSPREVAALVADGSVPEASFFDSEDDGGGTEVHHEEKLAQGTKAHPGSSPSTSSPTPDVAAAAEAYMAKPLTTRRGSAERHERTSALGQRWKHKVAPPVAPAVDAAKLAAEMQAALAAPNQPPQEEPKGRRPVVPTTPPRCPDQRSAAAAESPQLNGDSGFEVLRD